MARGSKPSSAKTGRLRAFHPSRTFCNRLIVAIIGRAAGRHRRGITVRRIFTAAMLVGAILTAGCNTVQGVGKDVASAGNAVAKVAK